MAIACGLGRRSATELSGDLRYDSLVATWARSRARVLRRVATACAGSGDVGGRIAAGFALPALGSAQGLELYPWGVYALRGWRT